VAAIPGIPGWDIWRYTATIWMVAVAAVALPMLWRNRRDPRARALAAVFGVSFVAGEVFNLYSQPQDPQMQINVMAWLTIAWALVLVAMRARHGAKGLAVLAGLTVTLIAYNVWSLAPLRGLDSKWRQAIERLERENRCEAHPQSECQQYPRRRAAFQFTRLSGQEQPYGGCDSNDQRKRKRVSKPPGVSVRIHQADPNPEADANYGVAQDERDSAGNQD
jgi:hypothetical protein